MLKHFRKLAGVSLFEMLLVMVIISMIVVAGIRFVKHQQEISADQAYGVKLYTFGQAVNEYVSHAQSLRTSPVLTMLPGPPAADGSATTNPDSTDITPGTDANGNPTLIIKGVEWLKPANAGTNKGVVYLDDKFTFGNATDGSGNGLAPLIVAADIGNTGTLTYGDAAFTTTISFVNPSDPTNSAYNITINAGVLYEQSSGKGANGQPPAPIPMAALSQDAVKHANELYTSYQGAAAITYVIPLADASGNYLPATAATGTISPIAQSGDAFLRIDGTNQMEASIHFDAINVSAPGNATIEDINSINFFDDPHGAANINQIRAINFNAGDATAPLSDGSINYPNLIRMNNGINLSSGASNPSQLLDLATLNFVSGNSISTSVNNLRTLNFVPGGTYHPGQVGRPASVTPGKKTCYQCLKRYLGILVAQQCCSTSPPSVISATPTIPPYTEPGSQITGLNEIIFVVPPTTAGAPSSEARSFMGIEVKPIQALSLPGNVTDASMMLITATGTYCALAQVHFHDTGGNGNGNDKYCTVASDGQNWILSAHSSLTGELVYCEANCFQFTTNGSPSPATTTAVQNIGNAINQQNQQTVTTTQNAINQQNQQNQQSVTNTQNAVNQQNQQNQQTVDAAGNAVQQNNSTFIQHLLNTIGH